VGAAIFAAIFNAVLSNRLKNAPAHIQAELPGVNKVVEVLQSHASVPEVSLYLRQAFFDATHNVYVGLVIFGIITLIILLLTPSRFPMVDE
jgi:hypothetical protein